MLIDGKAIAEDLKDALRKRVDLSGRRLRLCVIVAAETPEIATFVALKQKFGTDIGVTVDVVRLGDLEQKTAPLLQLILRASRDYDGIILQLPLPPQFDLDSVLKLFPLSHDVDVLGHISFGQYREGTLPFMPPVTAAMAEVLHREGIRLAGKRVLVVGEGRLVGAPAAIWAKRLGAYVKSANSKTEDLPEWTRGSDIIVLGAGVPGLLTPDMIEPGVIILDAGTSESEGVLKGDADPACAEKAALMTPTPGGTGPITVAKVFENLITLVEIKAKRGM